MKNVYFSIFESHLRYGCQIWGYHKNHKLNDAEYLQRKAIRIINFKNKYTPTEPLFKESKTFTLNTKIKLENCLLALNHINHCLLIGLTNQFRNENDLHNHNNRNSMNHQLALPKAEITTCGLHSVRYRTAKHWNFVQNKSNMNFADNFVSSAKFQTVFKEIITQKNPPSHRLFKSEQD